MSTIRTLFQLSWLSLALGACGVSSNNGDASMDGEAAASLARYEMPSGESSPYGIALDAETHRFYVGSSTSGRVMRGTVGATGSQTLEVLCDLTSSGVRSTLGISLFRSGSTAHLAAVGSGQLYDIEIRDEGCTLVGQTPVSMSSSSVAAVPNGGVAWVVSPVERDILRVDLALRTSTRFDMGDRFPLHADTASGFINAQGVAVSDDGRYVLIDHVIEKRIYRLDTLQPDAGVQVVQTGAANFSGNGMFYSSGSLVQVLSDEQRIALYRTSETFETASYVARFSHPDFRVGSEVVVDGNIALIVNGPLALGAAPPQGFDGGLPPLGDGGVFPFGDGAFPFGEGGVFPGPTTNAGTPRVLQISLAP